MKAPKKLRIQALEADLIALDSMISKAAEHNDVIASFQFQRRRDQVDRELDWLRQELSPTGRIALLFDGGPVLGSRGVEADFAGDALSAFQDLVSKTMAKEEVGQLGSRGPVAGRSTSQLIVTGVAKGSFGFLLEEAAEDAIGDTELKVVVDQVARLVDDLAAQDSEVFDQALANIDGRMLVSLRKFFGTLDSNRASVKLIEDDATFELARLDVSRARERIDRVEISDQETDEISGQLYLLPEHRKFELRQSGGMATIYGSVDRRVAKQILESDLVGESVVGRRWRTLMKIRTVQQPGREPRMIYTLKGLIEELD